LPLNHELGQLYESAGEDLPFGIDTIQLQDLKLAPIVQIHHKDWSRLELEVVRESFRDGLILTSGKRHTDERDLYIATRQRMAIQADHGGDTSVLRSPAWDAHLAKVEERVFRVFEAEIGGSAGYHARLACGHCARKGQMGKIGRGVYP
jgi:hypothetical protein